MGASIYKNKKPAIIFLIPAFLFMIVYLYYPFLQNIWNSFQNIRQLGSSGEGFLDPWYSNYVEMFHDEVVWISLKNTLIMMLVTLVGQVGIAIVLALMVDNITHGKHFYKTVYFFPIVISATALGLLFNLIFLYDKGMLNQILEKLGKVGLTDWKGEGIALFTMMLPVMWQYVGFYFVILITGLNNISDELYEAARIDGASTFQKVRYISIPLLHNVICTCSVSGSHRCPESIRPALDHVPEGDALKEHLPYRNLHVLSHHGDQKCRLWFRTAVLIVVPWHRTG
mgnify:CR=1 FL=1